MVGLEQRMTIEEAQSRLEDIVKPFQQELNQREKKSDFIKKCIHSLSRSDFFQLDTLLKSRQAEEIVEVKELQDCRSIFSHLRLLADHHVEQYTVQFKNGLTEAAEKAGFNIVIQIPQFTFMKGIEGVVDFERRKTSLNNLSINSFDPRRIVSAALQLKKKLYGSGFNPQEFIDGLFHSYQEILKQEKQPIGSPVSIHQLYSSYVWSLQSKAFLQNMDKSKFKGYSLEQFSVDFWRFFSSDVSYAKGGYSIRLAAGRLKSIGLIDQTGEKRLIAHASFVKSSKNYDE